MLAWIYRGHGLQEEPTEPESCANPEPELQPQPQLEPEPQGAASEGADGISYSQVSGKAPTWINYTWGQYRDRHNIFKEILQKGHDEDFVPSTDSKDLPTEAPPGSLKKIEVFRYRVEQGYNLWHRDDRVNYNGLTGAMRPPDDDE